MKNQASQCGGYFVFATPDCEGARRSGLRGSRQDRPKPVHLKLQVDCQRLLESHFRYMLGGMYFFIYANKNNGKTFFQTCYGLKFGSFPVITDFQQK